MGIYTNIGGTNKIVKYPRVNIGGTWKTCSNVYNNINGVWKSSYPTPFTITASNRSLMGFTTSLTSFTIPATFVGTDGNFYSVVGIAANAFRNCTKLTSLTITSGKLTTIGNNAFEGCTGLTYLEIPNGVTSVGNEVFKGCTSLEEVNFCKDVSTIGSNIFANCTSMQKVNVVLANNSFLAGSDTGYALFNKDQTALLYYPANKAGASYTIPSSVKTIGSYAFENCQNLTSITMQNGITTISEYAFNYCTNITTLQIPATVTSIEDMAFRNCPKLASFKISPYNKKYTVVDDVLFNIGKTKIISYPCAKTGTTYTIPATVTSIATGAFIHAFRLTSFAVESGNTVYIANGGVLFGTITVDNTECLNLACYPAANTATSYSMPSKIGTKIVVSIGAYSCTYCTNIKAFSISGNVTNIYIGAFQNCTALTTILIQTKLTSISNVVFLGCDALTKVNYTGTEAEWNKIKIGTNNTALINATKVYNYGS